MKYLLIYLLMASVFSLQGQTYTSYFDGNADDIITSPKGGICLMGGSTEHNEAMKWFLERANGGDILVLRTSGSDGYNSYLYSYLGVDVNSVETIVCNSSLASYDHYVLNKIKQAEAIWFAGGDQWDYISYWRNTRVDSLINEGIINRNIVIGGTSAGMAIMGKFYFTAENGTVTSSSSLKNPYNSRVTVDSSSFFKCNILNTVITDTHYDNRDRKGRHIVFLARILTDYQVAAKGIACNEYTAVCIDENGIASVYGEYPDNDENAFFIQTNCELADILPENCSYGNSLNWNLNQSALKVYKITGTHNGDHTFDLNDWKTGSGGTWETWYVNNGTLYKKESEPINCLTVSDNYNHATNFILKVYPNPTKEKITIESFSNILELQLYDINGIIISRINKINKNICELTTSHLQNGIYLLKIKTNEQSYIHRLVLE